MLGNDILLHIQGYPDQTDHASIDAALAVAKTLSGRISGFAVKVSVGYKPAVLVDHWLGLDGIAKEAAARSAEACEDGIAYFRRQASADHVLHDTEIESADWGLEAFRRGLAARTFDFSIYCPPADGPDKILAETLILLSGRPVLIMPDGHNGLLERVVVGWDGSAPAARAMNDALPLLKAARSVQVVTVSGDKPADRVAPRSETVRHLARHGVVAEGLELDSNGQTTAKALERHLKAERADLLVMGAFGHSRLREIVLGGVTEHMLSNMPAAVWLSH